MLNWHIVSTKAEYLAGTPDAAALYFINETKQIYRGTEDYTKSLEMYTDTLPEFPAENRIYVNSKTLEGRAYVGGNWKQVIKPVTDTINADDAGGLPVTGKAVAAYVSTEVAKILGAKGVITKLDWDAANQVLDVYAGDPEDPTSKTSITFDGLGVGLEYNRETGKLSMIDSEGNYVGTAIKLDLERFVTGCNYDPNSKTIYLYFDGKTGAESEDKLEIPVGDLVDTYDVENTATIALDCTDNVIKGTVRISKESGNALIAKADGLYISLAGLSTGGDVSDKMDKVTGATAGNLPIFDANGQVTDSGVKLSELSTGGGEGSAPVVVDGKTIIKNADGALQVNEIEQSQVKELESTLNGKISTSAIASSVNFATTEAAASDSKVVSEKAIIGAVTWKVGM